VPLPTGTNDNCAVLSVTNNFNGTGDASGLYPPGTTTVIWTVTDIHGNSTTCTHSVMVNDGQAPAITCPADTSISVTNTETCATNLTFTVTASDNCPGVTISCIATNLAGPT